MTQWLRTLPPFKEDPVSIPSSHMLGNNYL